VRLAADKVRNRAALVRAVDAARVRGETIVLTNGCFDLLHVGHLQSFEFAGREGDRLVVAVNSDASVRRLKGEGRPLIAEAERAQLVAGFEAVEWVTIFDEDTPEALIRAIRPDVIVKGAEYAGAVSAATLPGAEFVASYGGRVVLVPMLPGASSTRIREKLRHGGSDV
jgi:D-beta-D-heptose 7-phosphate kinase/D-beta-D-heptose 1-phosphate adenosyltransferase